MISLLIFWRKFSTLCRRAVTSTVTTMLTGMFEISHFKRQAAAGGQATFNFSFVQLVSCVFQRGNL